jgi:hypothetical protein
MQAILDMFSTCLLPDTTQHYVIRNKVVARLQLLTASVPTPRIMLVVFVTVLLRECECNCVCVSYPPYWTCFHGSTGSGPPPQATRLNTDFKYWKRNSLTLLSLKAAYLIPELAIRESGVWLDEAARTYAHALLLHATSENKLGDQPVKCISVARLDCATTA